MDMVGGHNDFEMLGKLLNTEEEDVALPSGNAAMTPGSFGPAAPIDNAAIPKPKRLGATEIWEEEEIEEDDGLVIDPSDKRKRPEYDILYKQEVSASDCYLGIDHEKDPGTHCCNEIVVKITLPGESLKTLDLDVQQTRLTVQSQMHVLPLPLPYQCDAKNGNAKWDSRTEILSITLPIIRDD